LSGRKGEDGTAQEPDFSPRAMQSRNGSRAEICGDVEDPVLPVFEDVSLQ